MQSNTLSCVLIQLSITKDILEFFFWNCLWKQLSSFSHSSELLLSNHGWSALVSHLFSASLPSLSSSPLLNIAFVLWRVVGPGWSGVSWRTRVTNESPFTQCWLTTQVRVTSRRKCGGQVGAFRASACNPAGESCVTARLLFTGGSLRGLFCAPLHPAQVWSGTDMYPFHRSWYSRMSAVPDVAFLSGNETVVFISHLALRFSIITEGHKRDTLINRETYIHGW